MWMKWIKRKNEKEVILGEEVKEKKKMDPKKKKRIITGGILAALLIAIVGYVNISNAKSANTGRVLPVVEAAKGEVESTIGTSGIVDSEESKTYFAPVDATIQDFSLQVGDMVSAGQQLVTFDIESLQRETREAELAASETENEYQSSMAKSAENQMDFNTASVNVETYRWMIVSQRAYINNLNQAVAQRTANQNALQDSNAIRQADIADGIARKNKEINDIGTVSGNGVNGEDEQRIAKLRNEILDLERESARLGLTQTPAGATPEVTRIITEAQQLLADMEGYLGADKGVKEAAENGILNRFEKGKLQATREKAALQVEKAKDRLAKASAGLHAEFNGIVSQVEVENGATVASGAKILKIESSDSVKVTLNISKYDLDKIKINQQVDIDIAGNKYTGKVSKINRIAQKNESGTPVVKVEVHIDNPDQNIYLGVEAKVVVHVEKAENVIIVPVETVNTDIKGTFCYVIENGVVTRKGVTTGISSDTEIEIKEGLKEGDQVISLINDSIKEGMPATAMPTGNTEDTEEMTETQ